MTGALVRTLFDSGGTGLGRRLAELSGQSALTGTAGASGELWFVIEGNAQLDCVVPLSLRADQGVWLPPGLAYSVSADGPGTVRIDMVTLPATPPGAGLAPGPVVPEARETNVVPEARETNTVPECRNLRDREVETTGDRRFRVLFGPGAGCQIATQFVGEIPPGRAPDHSHPYDELVLVLDGEGIVHVGGTGHPVAPGTCTHLPPGVPHCMENTGSDTMRVLGVFHPADSPAAKLGSP